MSVLAQYPDRPMMPTQVDQERSMHQFTRLQILLDEFDDVIDEWRDLQVGSERAQIMGIPDTSMNSLANYARQLSTPGLYGRRPKVRHAADPEAGAGMVGPEGLYTKAGVWSRMVWVQFLALGLSDIFARWDVDRRGNFTMRLVAPHNIYLVASADNPAETVELWELRKRPIPQTGEWIYTWDVYSIGHRGPDGEFIEGQEPSFRIYKAKPGLMLSTPDKARIEGQRITEFRDGGLGEDVSNLFVFDKRTGKMGPLVGESYPWVGQDGEPELPWGHWRDADTGMQWNTFLRRGAHRGALNVALYYSYAGHCALDATGSTVFAWGLTPHGVDSIIGDGDQVGSVNRSRVDGSPPVKTFSIAPGSVIYHDVKEDGPHGLEVIGPGVNLPDVQGWAIEYALQQHINLGLGAGAASRRHANPTSGSALAISNEERREHSNQVRPVFERSDQQALRRAAIVARVGGLGTFPETGYSWEYYRIPRTPTEKQEDRDELDWKKNNGQISEVEMYMQQHPGTTREDAMEALVRVSLEDAQLAQLRQAALVDAGLVESTPDVPVDLDIAPTDVAAVVKADEVRATKGLGPIEGGQQTVAVFRAGAVAPPAATTIEEE